MCHYWHKNTFSKANRARLHWTRVCFQSVGGSWCARHKSRYIHFQRPHFGLHSQRDVSSQSSRRPEKTAKVKCSVPFWAIWLPPRVPRCCPFVLFTRRRIYRAVEWADAARCFCTRNYWSASAAKTREHYNFQRVLLMEFITQHHWARPLAKAKVFPQTVVNPAIKICSANTRARIRHNSCLCLRICCVLINFTSSLPSPSCFCVLWGMQ